VIAVSSRSRRREDRNGDPLDGLVNLFDLGIVLAVGFLLAALASLHLTDALTHRSDDQPQVVVPPGDTSGTVPPDTGTVIGNGTEVGKVYKLSDGTLVYVVPSADAAPSGATQ
jgi:hypothetical protein